MEYNDDNYQSLLDEQPVSRSESKNFIIVDLSGIRYRILKSKIRQYPTTLLYKILDWSKKGKMYYMPKNVIFTPPSTYFFQRSPALFHLILQFYSNGANIHWPQNHCHKEIQEELRFWGVDSWVKFSPCCYDRFTSYNMELDQTWRETGPEVAFHHRLSTSGKMDLGPPMDHYKMLVFDSVSIGVVLISTVNFILSTVPELQYCPNDCTNNSAAFCVGNWSNASVGALGDGSEFANYLPVDARCNGTRVFGYVEAATMIWFTFELIVRFAASSSVRQFFRSPLNIVDVLSVVPYYVEVALWSVQKDSFGLRKARKARTILSFLRILRIFRVLKFVRYSDDLQILAYTFRAATKELYMLFLFLMITLVIFASLIYHIEKDMPGTEFTSVPAACWWGIEIVIILVTLSTVGYGDLTTKSISGKIVAGVACICGVLVMAFPVSILVEHFNNAYKERGRLVNRQNWIEQKGLKMRERFSLIPVIVTDDDELHAKVSKV